MESIPAVVNKHSTARVASCWFIIYYRLVMHGNVNIKFHIFAGVCVGHREKKVHTNVIMSNYEF